MFSKVAAVLSFASVAFATGISITPHDKYSSSLGVLGCHVNTNRIAYWPLQPGCNNLCKKVSANGRSVYLLHVDTSGGAYDISYDAWNYLNVGESAAKNPSTGGGFPAEWEDAPMSACEDLLINSNGKLALMAANSINTYVGCPEGSWLRDNAALYNIANCACTLGYNEVCTLDLAVSNQPKCAHMLGSQNPLSGLPVTDIAYGTGAEAIAVQ